MNAEHDTTFSAMGGDVRLLIGAPVELGGPRPEDSSQVVRRYVEEFARRLSRFEPESELCALNADPRQEVPARPLLRVAVRSAVWAATRTGGLVDPTLLHQLERAGYLRSLAGAQPAPLVEALAQAPPRRPARPHPDAVWRRVEVDDAAGVVRRPPGLVIDTGGTGKGLAADAAAHLLAAHRRFVVDCSGDIAIGGPDALARPYEVEVEHPLTGERVHLLRVGSGGVATSGLNVRIWRRPDGSFAHHLLDPSTGEPAWTGLVGATALGGTALEAETLSKHALLSGPAAARRVLAERGGVIFHDDGDFELVGPLRVPRLRVALPVEAAAA